MTGPNTSKPGRRRAPSRAPAARSGSPAGRQRSAKSPPEPDTGAAAGERLTTLAQVVPTMAMALGSRAEVVLHDLSRLPNSIIAVGGNLTNRSVGGPMTDLMLRRIRGNQTEDLLRYRVLYEDRIFQASTIFLRHPSGEPYGCLCINVDVTDLVRINAISRDFIGFSEEGDRGNRGSHDGRQSALSGRDGRAHALPGEEDGSEPEETYPQTVNELAESVVERSVRRIGIPVSLMKKEHKLEVVKAADMSGLFLMRSAADSIAERLQVSRYTIYNYLSEIRGEAGDATRAD